MRIRTIRCRTFQYAPTTANACAVGLAPSAVGVTRPFFDCLVSRVGVECGDLALGAASTRLIRRIAAETEAAYIVINGFAQLTIPAERSSAATEPDVLSHLADVLDVLADLTERLQECGERVHLMPFGWNKCSHAEVGEQRVIHLPPCADDAIRFDPYLSTYPEIDPPHPREATERTDVKPIVTVADNCSVDHHRSRICPGPNTMRHYRFRGSPDRPAT